MQMKTLTVNGQKFIVTDPNAATKQQLADSSRLTLLGQTVLTEPAGELLWTQTAGEETDYGEFFVLVEGGMDSSAEQAPFYCRAGEDFLSRQSITKTAGKLRWWIRIRQAGKTEAGTLWQCSFPATLTAGLSAAAEPAAELTTLVCRTAEAGRLTAIAIGHSGLPAVRFTAGTRATVYGRKIYTQEEVI